ncbi:MAG: GntR family transcriptional regulator [Anaerolineae bacterium]|nr:GntR family transcriptional regulator [Anaerolineae bacterium]MCA9896277.1 GntR family transcriptional regulator [Anaerolineae bacterium]MCB9461075.1 GntR family transcriptional regulator [Anaerolineaceae bacterium]
MDSYLANKRIERESHLPYYIQLKEILCTAIDQQHWEPGDRIPGEPELCDTFGISRTVVRQALNEMEHEGYITREKGKGTFVAQHKIRESLMQKLTGFYQDMLDRGLTPRTQVLKQRIVKASAKVANYLEIEEGEPVIEVKRLRSVNEDEPLLIVTSFMPANLCPTLAQADLENQSLYAFLESNCGILITRGRRFIEAVAARPDEAELLQVEPGSPLIMIDSVSYDDNNTPLEYYRALHRGDRSRFEIELLRLPERKAKHSEQ